MIAVHGAACRLPPACRQARHVGRHSHAGLLKRGCSSYQRAPQTAGSEPRPVAATYMLLVHTSTALACKGTAAAPALQVHRHSAGHTANQLVLYCSCQRVALCIRCAARQRSDQPQHTTAAPVDNRRPAGGGSEHTRLPSCQNPAGITITSQGRGAVDTRSTITNPMRSAQQRASVPGSTNLTLQAYVASLADSC